MHELIDVVSRGGNLLLNVGPTADGRIPVIMQQRLRDIGAWLQINGEAIYGTRAWTPVEPSASGGRSTEAAASANIRFTRKGPDLYAHLLEWPEEEIRIDGLGRYRRARPNRGTSQSNCWVTRDLSTGGWRAAPSSSPRPSCPPARSPALTPMCSRLPAFSGEPWRGPPGAPEINPLADDGRSELVTVDTGGQKIPVDFGPSVRIRGGFPLGFRPGRPLESAPAPVPRFWGLSPPPGD